MESSAASIPNNAGINPDPQRVDWDAVLRTATVGTRREPVPLPPSGPIAALVAAQPAPAAQLLTLAAVAEWRERVGAQPVAPVSPAVADHADTRPVAPLGRLLSNLRFTSGGALLPELLTALSTYGMIVPDRDAPALLAAGLTRRGGWTLAEWRSHIAPRLSYAVRSALTRVPEYEWASLALTRWESAVELIKTQTPADRLTYLTQLRLQDPALGRAVLASLWPTTADKQRVNTLATLRFGLGPDDEPFLERVLNDRDRRTRQKAAELLSHLPQSRLAGRLSVLAQQIVRWRRGNIHIRFQPHTLSAYARDGLPFVPDQAASKLAAAQLAYLCSTVPLESWCEAWQVTPATIAAAIPRSRWPRTLSKGFGQAIARQSNSRWAAAFIAQDPSNGLIMRQCASALDAAAVVQLIQQMLPPERAAPLERTEPSLRLLTAWRGTWEPALVHLVGELWWAELTLAAPESGLGRDFQRIAGQLILHGPPFVTRDVVHPILLHQRQRAPLRDVSDRWLEMLAMRGEMWQHIEAAWGDAPSGVMPGPVGRGENR